MNGQPDISPQIASVQSSNAINHPKILITIFAVVICIFIGGAYYLGKLNGTKTQVPPQPNNTITPTSIIQAGNLDTPTIKQQIVSPSPESIPSPTFQTKHSDLFKFSLIIPPNWTFKEINRKPEPTAEYDPKTGHDCADYMISSNNSYATFLLYPPCGYSDGGPNPWPNDSVIVKDFGNKKYIIRYFDNNKSAYIYAGAGDYEGGKFQTPGFNIGDDNTPLYIRNELRFTGSDVQKATYLQMVDNVILSLKKD